MSCCNNSLKNQDIKDAVRAGYAAIATGQRASCCGSPRSGHADPLQLAKAVGYDAESLAGLPDGANMGLSCGNPVAVAALQEGQIVLDRSLSQKGVYPPVSVLASLSRLMKDAIGSQYTREDHDSCSAQLFSSYARVQDVRALASVIGEEELSDIDKLYIAFGNAFENEFIAQGFDENRPMEATLDLGWKLLRILPPGELDRVDSETLKKRYYAE